jgi:rhomboid protease GluP
MGHPGLDAVISVRGRVTTILVAVIVVVSAAAFLLPDLQLTARLAKVNELLAEGEWWRLVTPALVHGGAAHLIVNVLALVQVGRSTEGLYGPGRLLTLFWLGTAAATATSWAFTPNPSVGASGGLFALVGALLAFGLRHRHALPPEARQRLVRGELWTVGVNLLFGFTVPYVDNAAHVGGLAAGFVLGWILGPSPTVRRMLDGLGRGRLVRG